MADQKLFAGPRVRRIRKALNLTQARMADGLAISASYLNLIESNSRPLTVPLLLKLSTTYGIDVGELQGAADESTLARLKAVFADPLLESELPGDAELIEMTETAPNVAGAVVTLHRAYTETRERLSELARDGREEVAAPSLPIDEVREAFARRPYCYPLVEAAATDFAKELVEHDDLLGALKAWLAKERSVTVQVLPRETMPVGRRRFDRHSRRLFLSERLSRPKQAETVAQEVMSLVARDAIGGELELMRMGEGEAGRLAGQELARYAALALMMPYRRTLDVAGQVRWDIEAVSARFGVTFAQGARRLIALRDGSRGNSKGPPMWLMEVDHAGNVIRRQGGFRDGFPGVLGAGRLGTPCPRLPVFEAFAEPGRTRVETIETVDGTRFLSVAKAVDGPRAPAGERVRRTAFLIGFAEADGLTTAYADLVPRVGEATGIGPTCRLCERLGCLARAAPPVTRPAHLDGGAQGIGPYSFS